MSTFTRFAFAALLLFIVIQGVAYSAGEDDADKIEYRVFNGISVPMTVGQYKVFKVIDDESKMPGVGYSIKYNGGISRITVFVYGYGNLPTGVKSPELVQHFHQIIKVINSRSIAYAESKPVPVPPVLGRPVLTSVGVEKTQYGMEASLLHVMTHNGYIIKFRINVPYIKEEATMKLRFKDANGFVHDFFTLLDEAEGESDG